MCEVATERPRHIAPARPCTSRPPARQVPQPSEASLHLAADQPRRATEAGDCVHIQATVLSLCD